MSCKLSKGKITCRRGEEPAVYRAKSLVQLKDGSTAFCIQTKEEIALASCVLVMKDEHTCAKYLKACTVFIREL